MTQRRRETAGPARGLSLKAVLSPESMTRPEPHQYDSSALQVPKMILNYMLSVYFV